MCLLQTWECEALTLLHQSGVSHSGVIVLPHQGHPDYHTRFVAIYNMLGNNDQQDHISIEFEKSVH